MNAHTYRPGSSLALIISSDPLGSALVGAAAEFGGIQARFVREDETAFAAIRRVRPVYLLIDCDDPAASDESIVGPAMMLGARIYLFGRAPRMTATRSLVARFGFGEIVLPRDAATIATILRGTSQLEPA